jgi:hypothetical protein
MKKLIFKTVEFLTGAKVHANHTAIKGNKSGGKADSSSYKNWQRPNGNGTYDDVN